MKRLQTQVRGTASALGVDDLGGLLGIVGDLSRANGEARMQEIAAQTAMPLTTFSVTVAGAGRQQRLDAKVMTAGVRELLQSNVSGLERAIALHRPTSEKNLKNIATATTGATTARAARARVATTPPAGDPAPIVEAPAGTAIVLESKLARMGEEMPKRKRRSQAWLVRVFRLRWTSGS